MPHPLDSFFAPSSIALIGASRDLEKIPGRLLSMLRKNDFPGKIYPINPNYGDIDGLKCYPAISDVGQPIDLAVVIIRHARCSGRSSSAPPPVSRMPSSSPQALRKKAATAPPCRDAIVALAKRNGDADFRPQCRRLLQRGAEGYPPPPPPPSPPPPGRPVSSSPPGRCWARRPWAARSRIRSRRRTCRTGDA